VQRHPIQGAIRLHRRHQRNDTTLNHPTFLSLSKNAC
jgi:hypothetical protein